MRGELTLRGNHFPTHTWVKSSHYTLRLAVKQTEVMIQATTWTYLENIMVNEMSQTQKDCLTPLT